MSNMVILTGSLTAVAAPMPDPSRNRDQHVGASRKIPVLEARHVGETSPKASLITPGNGIEPSLGRRLGWPSFISGPPFGGKSRNPKDG